MIKRAWLIAFALTCLTQLVGQSSTFIINSYSVAAGGGAIVYVQGNGASFDNVDPFSLAITSDLTAGNVLVVSFFSIGDSAGITPVLGDVTKSAGTATLANWVLSDYSIDTVPWGAVVAIYSAEVTGSGTCTIDIDQHFTTYNYGGLALMEFSGVDTTTGRRDNGADNSGTSTTPATAGWNTSGSTVIIGVLSRAGAANEAITESGDYILVFEEEDTSIHGAGSIIYRITSGSLTGETTDWTMAASQTWEVAASSLSAE